jgi:PHP family Zn ribbon phosphoesterase
LLKNKDMQQIADFHIHSRYSRACSRDLNLTNIDKTCRIKGIDIIGTGDFTFPDWFKSIEEELEEINPPSPLYQGGKTGGSGLYKLKSANDNNVKFILTTELALIYKKGDRCRRIHIVLHAPSLEAVRELNNYLDKKYNIRSDGRPILGMSAEELVKLCLSIHPQFLIYPAHIWTPWFSVFGSKSGFNTMEECFGDYTKDIFAYETGLSSDPGMNWRLSALDNLTLLSNSDAHSLPNLAREANVFEMNEASYDEIYKIIKNKEVVDPCLRRDDKRGRDDNKKFRQGKRGMLYTIEFYPEEGMYHFDGHRDCKISLTPEATKKAKGICRVCKKALTIGVLSRVMELADRPSGFTPTGAAGFKKLVELDKIIAQTLNIKSRSAGKVKKEYDNIIKKGGNELKILLSMEIKDIAEISSPEIALAIEKVREGDLEILPGYDGQYGEVKIFKDPDDKQNPLF